MVQRHTFSTLANDDELRYRNEVQLNEGLYNDVDVWAKRQETNKVSIIRFLRKRRLVPAGEGLEVGSGTSWFTAELSKIPEVTAMHALDFSEVLLTTVAPEIVRKRGGRLDKITFHVGDFHRLPFGDGSLDFVAADAALHHTEELGLLLKEIFRVLRPGGKLLAIHEPGIPPLLTPLTKGIVLDHGEHERQFGVTEKIYTQGEWRGYMEGAGFTAQFFPFFGRRSTWRAKLVAYTPLRWTNGLLFWSKVIVATKPQTPST